jgi:hypothetical protein
MAGHDEIDPPKGLSGLLAERIVWIRPWAGC